MLIATTAFPVIDPKLMAMALLAVPVPVIVWIFLAKFFASRADPKIPGDTRSTSPSTSP